MLYGVTLFFGICYGFFNLFQHSDLNLLFYILNLIYYGCALFFLAKTYKQFRITGGIHGKLGTQKVKNIDDRASQASSQKKKSPKKNKKHSTTKGELNENLLARDPQVDEQHSDDEKGPIRPRD